MMRATTRPFGPDYFGGYVDEITDEAVDSDELSLRTTRNASRESDLFARDDS